MKDPNQTLLEMLRYIFVSHPELRSSIEDLIFKERNLNLVDVNFLLTLNASNLSKSKSQIRQDLFVLSHLNFKREGFFVDFGATNGVDFNNSYLLEMEYGWSGILAEPAKCWHSDLHANRTCFIEESCVWSESNITLVFNEASSPELATVNSFSSSDLHARARENGKLYDVFTLSLNDLLQKYNAPSEIDYLSIDTEGTEFEILNSFDFSKYSFKVITCEHNYSPNREKLFGLLTSQGYVRVFESLSLFDDWYIKP